MASFGGLILTNKGRNLQTKAQTGVALSFTRITIGDGALDGSSILELNALKNQRKSMGITKLKVLSPGQATVGCVLNNQDITSGFYFREIGVFATDPDVGEVLYCYANAGATADYIPAGSGGGTDIIEKTIDVITLIGNAANVTAEINQSLVFETPEGSQEKADIAEANAKSYFDQRLYVGELPLDNQPVGGLWFQIIHPDLGPDSLFISNSVISDTPPSDSEVIWLDSSNTPVDTTETTPDGELII